jgi:choline dehydrogenase-like flavoprotein
MRGFTSPWVTCTASVIRAPTGASRPKRNPACKGALSYPRGKVLGGCSSINGMIYMRGQAGDYDRWAADGNPGWSWQDVLPLFKKSENHFAGDSEFHGASRRMAGRTPAFVVADSGCLSQCRRAERHRQHR